jgi:hypothetical protein
VKIETERGTSKIGRTEKGKDSEEKSKRACQLLFACGSEAYKASLQQKGAI